MIARRTGRTVDELYATIRAGELRDWYAELLIEAEEYKAASERR